MHDVGKELKDSGREIVEKGLDGLAEVGERLGGALEGEGQDGDNPVEGVEMPNVQDNGEDEEPEAAEVVSCFVPSERTRRERERERERHRADLSSFFFSFYSSIRRISFSSFMESDR